MGLATSQLLASRGALISLADINAAALDTALHTLPDPSKHLTTVVDVRSTKSVDEWIEKVVERFGRLDGAVNMAGIITPARNIDACPDAEWEQVMDVNAGGVFRCLRAQIGAMKRVGVGVGAIVSSLLPCVGTWEGGRQVSRRGSKPGQHQG
jgi:NAD(P)-dependent dehydrogenase (short-subunit alcohol dehydrogenase family)